MAQNDEQFLDTLRSLSSAKRLNTTPSASPDAAKNVQSQLSLRDSTISALQKAPRLGDRAGLIAQGKDTGDGGALGTVGKLLIDNPISKTVLGGLSIVDTPRRFVISTARELVDAVDGDPRTDASFKDLFTQTKDVSYGFGTAFPMDGWGGRVVGFLGDVLLDPMTYATFGAKNAFTLGSKGAALMTGKTVAGSEGRFALARIVKELGASDDIVKAVAAKGRTAIPKQLAEDIGLKRAGIYYFGSRVRVPLSGPVADALQKGLVKTRLSFFDTATGEKLGKKFALRGTREQGDTSLARFNLATGKIASGKEAAAQIANLGAEDTSRAYQKIAQDTAAKYINPILADEDVYQVKSTVYRLLDNAPDTWQAKNIVPTPQEMRAYEKLKSAFELMHRDVQAAFRTIDPNFDLGKIDDYLPHIATDDALKLMEDGTSAYGKQIREYLSVNMTDAQGSFRARNIRVGAEFFGKKLTKEDVAGGVVRLNEIARESGKIGFDFFETDIQKIMAKYAGYYSKQVGTAKYMEELFKAGILSSGIEEISISKEAIDAARAGVVAATNARSQSLDAAFKSGKKVSDNLKKAFDDLLKKKGPLEAERARSAQDLVDIIPVNVAEANLQAARTELNDTIKILEDTWVGFQRQFDEQSDILGMMDSQHMALVQAHRDLLGTVDGYIARYAEDSQKVIDWSKELDGLRNQLSDVERQISDTGDKWVQMLEDQDRLMNFFDDFAADPYSALSREGDQVMGTLRPVRFGDIKTVQGEKTFSRWAGENTSDVVKSARKAVDPRGEFSVNELGKLKYEQVREIITTGFTSGSDLRELRKAATWLVARDVMLNDGVLPNTPEFLARFDKMQKLIRQAEKVDEFIKTGVARKAASGKNAIATEKQILELQQVIYGLNEQENVILSNLDGAYELGFSELDKFPLSAQRQVVYNKIADEISPERALRELGPLDIVNHINKLEGELADVRLKRTPYEKSLAKNNEARKLLDEEVIDATLGGNYRDLAGNLSETIAEYHIYSQVQLQFSEMVNRASKLGLIPTEQMYNKLVSVIVKNDLELADNFVVSLKQADDLISGLKSKVLQYRGQDLDVYLYSEFSDIFTNPERAVDAELIRQTFPEMEAVWAKHNTNMRGSRAFFQDQDGENIAYAAVQQMDEFGLNPQAGAQTGRRGPRQAKAITGSDRYNAEDIKGLRVRSVGSEESQIAEWDTLSRKVKGNISTLKKFAASSDATDAQKSRILELVSRYEAANKRVTLRKREAQKALKKVTGMYGGRTNATIVKNIAELGDSYGIYNSFNKALNGGRYNVESFFAELIGGSKFDFRQGTRSAKIQQGKLVGVIPARNEFVNIFQDDLGRLIDADGKLVNTSGELIDESSRRVDRQGRIINQLGELVDGEGTPIINPKTGSPFKGDGAVDGYVLGKKSPIPNQLIQKEDSLLSKVRQKAQVRRNKLANMSDDADFIPMDVIKSGSIDSRGEVSWIFSDNLYGPRGYANQLELQLSILDDRIKTQSALEKTVAKGERKAAGIAVPRPSAKQAAEINKQKANALRAAAKLQELESTFFYPRAVERQKFHDFLTQFASMSEDDVVNLDFGISSLDAGVPVTRYEALRVYTLDRQIVQNNIARIEKELDSLDSQITRVSKRTKQYESLQAQINDKQLALADQNSELQRVQTIIDEAGSGKSRLGMPQEMRFGFTKQEFRSLWTPELSQSEIKSLNGEWISLRKQLVSRRNNSWQFAVNPEENYTAINDIVSRMAEIDELIVTNQSRDVAIRKAKYLHTKFEDPQYQGTLLVSDRETISRRKFDTSVKSGDRNAAAQLQQARAMGQISEQDYRAAVGFAGPTTESQYKIIPVSPEKALGRFMKGKSRLIGRVSTERRALLKEIFNNSEEGKYLSRIADLRLQTQSDISARPRWAETAAGLRSQKEKIIRTINTARGEIDELNISSVIDDISKTMDEAEKATGVALARPEGQNIQKTGKVAAKKLVKDSEARAGSLPAFVRDEELFGSLEAAKNNTLTPLQAQRRDILKNISRLEFDILKTEQGVTDFKTSIQSLMKISDRQAAILGLPSKTNIRAALDSGKALRAQMVVVESLGETADKAWAKVGSEWQRLNEVVKKAEVAYGDSVFLRRTAEENMDIVKRQIETVKEMAKTSTKLSKKKKGDAAWIAGLDDLLADAEHYIPMIENGTLDDKVANSLLEYIGKRAVFAQESLALGSAQSELSILKGLKNLTSEELQNVRQLRPDAINIKTTFDKGFVQLSEYFPNIGVQKELAEIVQNVHRLQDPAVVRELSKFLSSYTRFFKGYATLSPGFHIRNAMSNGFMLFAAGGNPARLAEGIGWSRSWTEASKAGKTFDQWIVTVPQASREKVKNAFLVAAASGGGMTDEVFKKGALFGTKTSRKIGERLEQHSRFMLAYDGIASGMDFHTAAARVRRFLIDYENVSSADQVMRQIVPFWMWTSRNLPMQVQNIWLNPRAYQIYGSIKRNLREEDDNVAVPQWMQEIGAFKLPFGDNLYATPDFGFNRIGAQVQEFKDPTRLLSNLNPLLRLPIELAGGRQLYSNRPFSDTPVQVEGGISSAVQPLLEALGYGQTGPTGKKFVDDRAYYALRNLLPFLATAERLNPSIPTFQQRGTGNQWLGFIGAPVRQVTGQMQASERTRRDKALQQAVDEQIALEGG